MKTHGSSLVESLVALSVFSIGSAATGAWFVRAVADDARVSRAVAARVMATSLAARMRANAPGASGGGYTNSPKAGYCATSCNAMALAADDMRRFHETLKAGVGPSADGEVSCETTTHCVIRIAWRGREVLAWPVQV